MGERCKKEMGEEIGRASGKDGEKERINMWKEKEYHQLNDQTEESGSGGVGEMGEGSPRCEVRERSQEHEK